MRDTLKTPVKGNYARIIKDLQEYRIYIGYRVIGLFNLDSGLTFVTHPTNVQLKTQELKELYELTVLCEKELEKESTDLVQVLKAF